MYFACVSFRGVLGFLNCDDICMRVVNKQFVLLELFLIPFMLTCNVMRFLSLLLLGMCPCVVSVFLCGLWSVFEVDVVSYVNAVVAGTVMRVLLFA